jgi:formylglycine-generating enzyme
MTRKSRTFGAVLVGAFLLLACEEKPAIGPEPGSTGVPGGGAGGAGGSGAAPVELACPTGVAGGKQVLITVEGGGGYCIDQLEVTRGEYQTFLDAKKGDTSGQPKGCADNSSFEPPQDPLEDPEKACPTFSLERYPKYRDYPVVCVDFCDAFAYCAWAGKRMCGKVGDTKSGVQTMDQDTLTKVAGSTESEWAYACSQGGKTAYPYGDSYESGKCIDKARLDERGTDSRLAGTEGETCHGTEPPFDQIFHLSGSVTEWINFCDPPNFACGIVGGGGDSPPEYFGCFRVGTAYLLGQNGGTGFRCCADAVSSPASP